MWGVWDRDVACNVRTEVWREEEEYFREILTNSQQTSPSLSIILSGQLTNFYHLSCVETDMIREFNNTPTLKNRQRIVIFLIRLSLNLLFSINR